MYGTRFAVYIATNKHLPDRRFKINDTQRQKTNNFTPYTVNCTPDWLWLDYSNDERTVYSNMKEMSKRRTVYVVFSKV